jgi:hypothetical protein
MGGGLSENDADIKEWHISIDHKVLRWESYVKAGYYVGTPLAYQNV